jgi:hypothetical protein
VPVVIVGLILLTPTLHHASRHSSGVVREDGILGLSGPVENAGNKRFLGQGIVTHFTDRLHALGEREHSCR